MADYVTIVQVAAVRLEAEHDTSPWKVAMGTASSGTSMRKHKVDKLARTRARPDPTRRHSHGPGTADVFAPEFWLALAVIPQMLAFYDLDAES